ncbi:hypothetical protein B9T27_06185 [Acinetobacter sp. ANC 4648]|nr:hypothetical protein B9T27_06185 [Acinetobacter sp. ANC 4648]
MLKQDLKYKNIFPIQILSFNFTKPIVENNLKCNQRNNFRHYYLNNMKDLEQVTKLYKNKALSDVKAIQ